MCSTGLENLRVSGLKRGYPSMENQRVSRLKRGYPTTRKLMRLCQSMASDSPSEPSYIGWMNTLKNHQREVNFLVDSGCTGAIMNYEFVFQHKLPWVKRAEPVKVTGRWDAHRGCGREIYHAAYHADWSPPRGNQLGNQPA
jgi:hypothetical protein